MAIRIQEIVVHPGVQHLVDGNQGALLILVGCGKYGVIDGRLGGCKVNAR